MSLRTRRIILFLFILLFFVSTPLVIVYTAGYRYNFKKNKFEKTGMLIIDSKPRQANVNLDNKPLKQRTRARVKNLLPGDYQVKIYKDGYYDWQKTLEVQSALTTFAAAALFKKELPINIFKGEIKSLTISPNGKIGVLELREELNAEIWMINLNTKKTALLLRKILKPETNFKITWAPNSSKIIIKKEGGNTAFLVYDVNNIQNIQSLEEITGLSFEEVKWDSRDPWLLYAQKKNQIYRINLLLRDTARLLTAPPGIEIKEFSPQNGALYFIINKKKKVYLTNFRPESEDPFVIITELPNPYFKFTAGPSNLITLIQKMSQDFYLIDPEQKLIPIKIEGKAKGAEWLSRQEAIYGIDEPQLLFYNDFEIWTYDKKTDKKILVTRLGKEIKKALWYTSAKHIIFSVDNKIKIIEIAGKNGRNVIDLVNFDKVSDMQLGSRGEKLYFIGEIGTQKGLYELEL